MDVTRFNVGADVTFSDLRKHYGTGRAYTISGSGRNRVTGYRVGVKCALGDIEESEWFQMVRDLIDRSGEQKLHQQLLEYVKDNYPWCKSKKECEREALELHAARIFDDQTWVGFMKFNQKYRPGILESVEMVSVIPGCCKKPGRITQAMLERHSAGENYSSAPRAANAVALCTGLRAQCPLCGRWTSIMVVE